MSNQQGCPEMMWEGYHTRVCGRAFKTDEQREAELCGIHLRASLRRVQKNREYIAKRDEQANLQAAAEEGCRELKHLGVSAEPEYRVGLGSRMGGYTGRVVTDPESLLARLAGALVVEGGRS